jgi:hypothetical protein
VIPTRLPAAVSILVATALVSAACASSTGDVIEPDWNNPIEGEVVASVQAAEASVPFEFHVPKGLAHPSKILVSSSDVPKDERQVAFFFETDRYGLVSVGEGPAVPPASEWEEFIQSAVDSNGTSHGSAEIVTLENGTRALVTTSEDEAHSDICWVDRSGTIEFCVLGPRLTRDDVVEIANSV